MAAARHLRASIRLSPSAKTKTKAANLATARNSHLMLFRNLRMVFPFLLDGVFRLPMLNRIGSLKLLLMLYHNQQFLIILLQFRLVLPQLGDGFHRVHHSGVVAPAKCIANGRQA